jgi:hypothetical protein
MKANGEYVAIFSIEPIFLYLLTYIIEFISKHNKKFSILSRFVDYAILQKPKKINSFKSSLHLQNTTKPEK